MLRSELAYVQLIGHSDDYMPGIPAIALHDCDVSAFLQFELAVVPCMRAI